MMPPEIFTIGYEGASPKDLIAALKDAGVTRLLDIRAHPYSLREVFCAAELEAVLLPHGIAYDHLGTLGTPESGRHAARLGHRAVFREIFAAYMATAPAQRALARAITLAQQEAICLLCLERAAQRCHRSIVAQHIAAVTGQQIRHLTVSRKAPDPAQMTLDFGQGTG